MLDSALFSVSETDINCAISTAFEFQNKKITAEAVIETETDIRLQKDKCVPAFAFFDAETAARRGAFSERGLK